MIFWVLSSQEIYQLDSFNSLQNMFRDMGVETSLNKIVGPTSIINCAGTLIDAQNMMMTVLPEWLVAPVGFSYVEYSDSSEIWVAITSELRKVTQRWISGLNIYPSLVVQVF